MHNLITERTPAAPWWCRNAGMVRVRLSRSVGYLGNARCSSDSQILARNGVLWLRSRANQKSKTTQSALCLDEASAVCQARTPHGRGACEFPLSPVGFRTPTAANPDTKTQEGLCCDVLLCLEGARLRGARAPHATPPAGYGVRWRRQAERAQTRCAVHANA